MESKNRVIVIDLFGESEETAVKVEKAGDHECRCGICNCSGKGEPERPELQLELQLQSYELPAQGIGRPVPGAPSVSAQVPARAARRYLKH